MAGTQDYAHGPTGTEPTVYPVIVKPITNLLGMGRGARVSTSAPIDPGMMWAEMLTGRFVSTDAVLDRGQVTWAAQAIGFREVSSLRFVLWTLLDEAIQPEMQIVSDWAERHLSDYTGPLNVETIKGAVIEAHLRLTADWQSAGVYEPLRRAVGVPVWQPARLLDLPAWAVLSGEDERPMRHSFVVAPL